MDTTRAYYAPIFEMVGRNPQHMLDVYVPHEDFAGHVRFTDPKAAKRLGIDRLSIATPKGRFSPADGIDFIQNLFRHFVGNTHIICDQMTDGHVDIAPGSYPRDSKRGEPSVDPMEDIDGQYRRFQQRERES